METCLSPWDRGLDSSLQQVALVAKQLCATTVAYQFISAGAQVHGWCVQCRMGVGG